MTSPLYFILALEAILPRHDCVAGKGVSLGHFIIHTLGYADDAVLLDYGDVAGLARAEQRVIMIAEGSRRDADMSISIKKTKVLHVRQQERITSTTTVQAKSVSNFFCPHLHCGFHCRNRRGMLVHADRCKWRDEFVVENILECKGADHARK